MKPGCFRFFLTWNCGRNVKKYFRNILGIISHFCSEYFLNIRLRLKKCQTFWNLRFFIRANQFGSFKVFTGQALMRLLCEQLSVGYTAEMQRQIESHRYSKGVTSGILLPCRHVSLLVCQFWPANCFRYTPDPVVHFNKPNENNTKRPKFHHVLFRARV